MQSEDNLTSEPPGASLSECELPDQDVGIADRLVAVIADILFFRDDSHVVSLIPVGPRSRPPDLEIPCGAEVDPAGPWFGFRLRSRARIVKRDLVFCSSTCQAPPASIATTPCGQQARLRVGGGCAPEGSG